jgi:hypothetical protein
MIEKLPVYRPNLLDIYLNDHLMGAVAGVGLARRLASSLSTVGPSERAALKTLAQDVAEDRAALLEIMGRLGTSVSRAKAAAGRIGEKAGRAKLNGRMFRRSPLSDVVELEAMYLGVRGKLAGWQVLRTLAENDSRLDPTGLDHLIDRARDQADLLDRLRTRAAVLVFTSDQSDRAQA